MEILFTKNTSPLSYLIRKITKEPVSHCAIRIGEFVIHSNLFGVSIVPYIVFAKKNTIVNTIFQMTVPLHVTRTLAKCWGKRYDMGALFYLGLRFLLPRLVPKQNLWQSSGMFLCTEFVTYILTEQENSLITPYQLYKLLNEVK